MMQVDHSPTSERATIDRLTTWLLANPEQFVALRQLALQQQVHLEEDKKAKKEDLSEEAVKVKSFETLRDQCLYILFLW